MGRTIGIIMIIVGAVMLIWTGFSYTKKEKVVDLGPLEITADKKEQVNWPPYVGAGVLVVGLILAVTTNNKRG